MDSARRLADIEPFYVMELLARAKELEAEGRDVIHMEVGEPDFVTPEPVRQAGARAIIEGRTFYTNALGLPELREAISRFYLQRYGVTVPASRIAVTAGASGALVLALACLANPGDEWLLSDPGYPCNRHFVRSFEGVPVGIPVDAATGFQPTADHLREYWSARTRGVMVASPANPTGTMLTASDIASLASVTRERDAHLIVDEIYHGLTYDGDASTALAQGDDIFVVNSFSKYFQMTGWRLGWLVIPEKFVRDIEKLAQNLFISASTAAQYAAVAAFEPGTIEILEQRRAEMKKRRDFLVPALESVGLKVPVRPSGAFYIYADCSGLTDDSDRFCRDLLEAVGVAVTPGKDFGLNKPQTHVRLAYANDIARLSEAVDRIRSFLSK
ncbi:MAG TPA: pyridoxal phosphate-dependent aminotransferase [Myxococcota bacterium]|nr:pyridoxal phosphate-dependent aminotransferase [Myxococcota bacterium]HNZ03817.1 pyridoxal phosphate-dependent aminotransferase [Myxococcota bacterium]HOD08576.1 pyridoxal phosphate-dependent aminotransferase [Myxococcota bacterium]HPB49977.1 pyridoxal phosphate-dependent aminotransferase [Myxococcota bacterium]HQP95020.1 pyridoxal phosphate-dependent aminotransferase [Myxococcota bacterium]